MAQRTFQNDGKFIHIPIHDEHPKHHCYVKILDGDKPVQEFHIGIANSGKTTDFYVPLYLGNYHGITITLLSEEDAPNDLFNGCIAGDAPQHEKRLYPDLYREETRQQIHFSPCRGWLNDPNGLFWKDGKFHLYFQHNPFGSRHGGVNVSWGHAESEDGVHFTEYPDAIMPRSSLHLVASGSAFVDTSNVFGKGDGAVIAAYTALQASQYKNRPRVTKNGGQMLLYSVDDGKTFRFFENNPFIPVPDGEFWRDPKIMQTEQGIIAIVYEPVGESKRTSIYVSKTGKDWLRVSEGKAFHECPDFFEITVCETNERLFVMYGGHGLYSVGTFRELQFEEIERGRDNYLDYGDGESIYAGQTFSNYPDSKTRYHTAWLKDSGMCCFIADDYVFDGVGFHSSLSLICQLSLHKTDRGYRIFRIPHENLKKLRGKSEEILLVDDTLLLTPSEYCFTLPTDQVVSFTIGENGFRFDPETRTLYSSSGKTYAFCKKNEAITVRLFADARSLEFFLNDEICLTYFAVPKRQPLRISGEKSEKLGIAAIRYPLSSIWKNT